MKSWNTSFIDPDELRSKEEKEFWLARDPIKKFSKFIVEYKHATAEELKAIDKKITALIEEAVQFGLDSPEPNPEDLKKYIFAEESA